jgi:DNA-binding transcriptional MerR regulator
MAVTISFLADQVGVSTDAVRYYERRGLLLPPPRSDSGYRLYDEEACYRLSFIKSAQHAGLRLDDIKDLLEIMDRGGCPCGHTATLVDRRTAEVDAELTRLRALRKQLVALGEKSRECTELQLSAWWCAATTDCEGGEAL